VNDVPEQTAAVPTEQTGAPVTVTEYRREQRILLLSTAVAAALSGGGVILGLVAGSMAIVFDGMFGFIEVVMSLIALYVIRLATREPTRRFQYGYWHIEPMVLALYGGMLLLLVIWAFVDAIGSLLSGGSEVQLGWALAYSGVAAVAGFAMWAYERRENRSARSDWVLLDQRDWLMTGAASAAMLVAFAVAGMLAGSPYAFLAPYVDPATVAILSLAFAGLPIAALRQAGSEVLLIAPTELDQRVRATMDAIVEERGYLGYESYAAKVGRGAFIEIHILVDPNHNIGTAAEVDALRNEIANALDAHWPTVWLTVDLTADEEWA